MKYIDLCITLVKHLCLRKGTKQQRITNRNIFGIGPPCKLHFDRLMAWHSDVQDLETARPNQVCHVCIIFVYMSLKNWHWLFWLHCHRFNLSSSVLTGYRICFKSHWWSSIFHCWVFGLPNLLKTSTNSCQYEK